MHTLIAGLLSFLLVTNLPVYLSTIIPGFKPLVVYLPFLAYAGFAFGYRPHRSAHLAPGNRLLLWMGVFTLLSLLSAGVMATSRMAIELFILQSWMLVMAAAVVFIVYSGRHRLGFGYGLVLATLVMVLVNLLEFALPDFHVYGPQPGFHGRVGGLHGNPNISGQALVLCMFVAQMFLPRSIRYLYAALIGLAVLVTVSRSAMLLYMIATTASYCLGIYGRPRISLVLAIFGSIGVAILLLMSGEVPGILMALGLDKHFSPFALQRLSTGFFSQGDASSSERLQLATQSLALFWQHPLFGAGYGESLQLGYAADMGSHNMFLRMAADMGLIGLLAFVALVSIALAAQSSVTWTFLGLYFLGGMFNHTSLELAFYSAILPLGLAMMPPLAATSAAPHSQPATIRRRRRTVADTSMRESGGDQQDTVPVTDVPRHWHENPVDEVIASLSLRTALRKRTRLYRDRLKLRIRQLHQVETWPEDAAEPLVPLQLQVKARIDLRRQRSLQKSRIRALQANGESAEGPEPDAAIGTAAHRTPQALEIVPAPRDAVCKRSPVDSDTNTDTDTDADTPPLKRTG